MQAWASLVTSSHSIDLFFSAFTTGLSLTAIPFIVLKIPGIGEMFHQMRPTGYDAAGNVQLQLNIEQMRRKQAHAAKRGLLNKRELKLFKNERASAAMV